MIKEQIKWAGASRAVRVAAFFVLCAVVLIFQASTIVSGLTEPLELVDYVLDGHMSPWLVAGLALMLLWSNKSELWGSMRGGITWPYVFFGAVLVAISVLLPWYAATVIGISGVFCILFGRASRFILPGVIAYSIVLLFPALIDTHAQVTYPGTVLGPAAWVVQLLKLPVEISGMNISLTLPSSEEMVLGVVAACAGPTTMALFLSIFTLMYSYRPIPGQSGLMVLLVGVTGTWLQNVIRVTGLLVIGPYFGEDALWAAHEYLSYLLFPLWYLMFTAFYISVAKQERIESSYKLSLVPAVENERIHRTN